MFRFPDWCYRRLPSQPLFWALLWAAWFMVLWSLSSSDPKIDNGPEIPHLDKVMHFGYFMIGGFCVANFLHLKDVWSWKKIILVSVILGAAVGAIDEYHQSFNPTRSGNDFGDWLADTLGALAGSFYCYRMWIRLKRQNLDLVSER